MQDVPDPNAQEDFGSSQKSIDDYMFEEKAKTYALAYEQQFHHASYYAYLKLKEQEIRNICWFAELVTLNTAKSHPGWKKIAIPFKDVY